jgi:nicotinamidase-related amidase
VEPEELKAAALMVIDMQRYFLEPDADAYLSPAASLVPNAVKLIEAFRDAGRPVIFTRHAHPEGDDAGQMGRWWRGKLPRIGDPQSELIDAVAPAKDEPVIVKQRYSAFEGTDLHARLRRQNVDSVIICGVMTNLCVETTARHAFMKDLQPYVVEDACAAGSTEHHRASITNLEYGFAYIVKTRDVVGELRSIR